MSTTENNVITSTVLEDAMSYEAFHELIDEQLAQGKTTGSKQSDDLTNYTTLNKQRMSRLDKTIELSDSLREKLSDVSEQWIWLVLAEGWCGDVAQNLPAIAKIADESENIDLQILLRTENTDVMDQYLTNGGRSIPKLVCLRADSLEEIGTWGPRPGEFQQQAMQWKDDPGVSHEEWAEKLHKWYARDQSQTLQTDFMQLVDEWS